MGQGPVIAASQARAGAGTLLLALLLGGCSGTDFGDRLAGSFSATPQPPAAAPSGRAATPTTNKPPAKPVDSTPGGKTPNPDAAGQQAVAKPRQGQAGLVAPAPYRITIKLPSGDPSAPAEVVTQALRAAGVPFEVEMIERIQAQPSGTTVTPAPTPQPTPAPRPR